MNALELSGALVSEVRDVQIACSRLCAAGQHWNPVRMAEELEKLAEQFHSIHLLAASAQSLVEYQARKIAEKQERKKT